MFNGRPFRWLRDAAVLACCGAVGFLAIAAPRLADNDDNDASGANPRIALSELADARNPAAPSALASTDVEPPGPAAPTPLDAVERFLAAEIGGDYPTSYGLLSATDREEIGSSREWEAVHGQLPLVTGFTLGSSSSDSTRAEVDADVTFKPSLDETLGLVPARAQAVWIAVAEDGGWRVARSESQLTPQYPDESGAASAAEAWAQARTDCRAEAEYDGGLLGAVGPVAALCDAPGPVEVGDITSLEPGVGVEPFLAAFGPEVLSWARVVAIAGPVSLAVVLAPVADRWVVIGALESLPGGSS